MTIRQMYRPMPLSPHTWLSAAVDSTATTFNVYDTNVFPDPPFYAVILDGARTETVRVMQLAPGVLSGIVRGVEGTATSHAVDTPLARNFTAADHNDIIDNVEYLFASHVIGVQWDRGAADPTALTWIDVDGNPITSLPFGSFDNHRTYREVRRCLLSTTGTPTFGTNARGDGLTLDGTMGRVMVSIPKFWVRADSPSTGVYRWWISPVPASGFEVHPAFRQRGGVEREAIYVGAYHATLHTRDYPAHASSIFAFHSRTGEQPVTCLNGTKTMEFTSGGTTAPTIGETITGASSGATAVIVDWSVSSGTWAGGDAAGTLILKQPTGTFTSENLNGSVSGSNFATGAATVFISLKDNGFRTFAENIGPGWGEVNIWSWSAVKLLMLIEAKTWNLQSWLGRGVCDLAAGSGYVFNGRPNGYGSADSSIGTNGTGTALGTNGQTPVVWRGIESPWGNIEFWVDGAGADSIRRKFRAVSRGGTDPMAWPTSGETMTTAMIPYMGPKYATDIWWEPLVRYVFLPKTGTTSSEQVYLCDKFIGAENGHGRCGLVVGGINGWSGGDGVGPFSINLNYGEISSDWQYLGARIEYVGPEGPTATTTTVTPGGGGEDIVVPAPIRVTTATITPREVTSTPPAAPENPSTPNTDPPIYVVPAQTLQDGSLLGGNFGFGYNPAESGVVLKWDAGSLNTNATTCLMTGQTTATEGKSFTYSFGYQLYRQPTGYGSAGYLSAGIPQGATVTGITVKRYGSYTGASPATGRDLQLFLRFTDPNTPGGWIDSDDYAKLTTDWQYHSDASHGIYLTSYGGPTDLWGLTAGQITPEILNNGGVQVVLQVESLANGGTAGVFRLYALQVEISYEV